MQPNQRQASGAILSCDDHFTNTLQVSAQSITGPSANLIAAPINVRFALSAT